MVYRIQNAVNRVEDILENFDTYTSLAAVIQNVPTTKRYQTKHMSDYFFEKIANV
ncbi:MAG: hypothetical protein PHC66_01070 [Candidatus Nanoarchaeia archaeon]|nr:hypothetical protein [Candidatus Nanoarchaeia archaeon]MDD5239086.1 hypothetical protein [Candidatus Nanoarchaeia archaeon]